MSTKYKVLEDKKYKVLSEKEFSNINTINEYNDLEEI
jgi:molybdopterin-guanine dinucleotide biosynthesis protein A